MGIDHKVMTEITPGIISFANIGAFIDAPMKTYSSGMRARVGFSIATAVDPDILLLDEVLQTGDNAFKKKSRRRIAEVLQTAKAVVMVTHDMSWITAFCTRAVLLDKGHIVREGDPDEIADIHEEDAEKRKLYRRRAVQLVKHGKADLVDLRKARREGTLASVAAQAGVEVSEDGAADDELAGLTDDESRDELRALRATVAAEAAKRGSGEAVDVAGRRSRDGRSHGCREGTRGHRAACLTFGRLAREVARPGHSHPLPWAGYRRSAALPGAVGLRAGPGSSLGAVEPSRLSGDDAQSSVSA